MTNQASSTTAVHEQQLARVRALLAKAESTTFPEEAAALTAKAHELMVAHAISAAMVQERAGEGDIRAVRIEIHAPYVKQKYLLLSSVAKPNNCRAILGIERSFAKELIDSGALVDLPHGMRFATVVGYQSDLGVVETLFTSLLLQAVNLMMERGSVVTPWGNETRSFRNAFLLGFAGTIGQRLEANTRQAAATTTSGASSEVLPVLASRYERVEAATDELFPNTRTLRTSLSNGEGLDAGRRAAHRADLGATRFRPPSRSLGPS